MPLWNHSGLATLSLWSRFVVLTEPMPGPHVEYPLTPGSLVPCAQETDVTRGHRGVVGDLGVSQTAGLGCDSMVRYVLHQLQRGT